MAGSIQLPHTCPQCGKTAKDSKELLALFGYQTVPSGSTNQKTCDRCGRHAEAHDFECPELLSINHKVGYSSIFGDTNRISMDLCQHCVKEVLGQWITITEEPFKELI